MTADSTKRSVASEVGAMYDAWGGFETVWGYNIHFGYWDDPSSQPTIVESTDRLTEVVISRFDVGAGDHVLDVGCGFGEPAIRLARSTGASVTGISVSALHIESANERARREGLSEEVRFQYADAMNMPFPSDTFDAVLALESMQDMPDRGQVLRECARVMRSGGRMAIFDAALWRTNPISEEIRAIMDQVCKTFMLTFITPHDYRELVRAAGLEIEEFLDLTDKVGPSHDPFAKAVVGSREAVESHMGTEGFESICAASSGWARILDTVGHLLMVLRKP
jgi:O-methyltransferase StaMB